MATAPDTTREYLRQLACRLDAAEHGGKGALLDEARALYGWSTGKLYTELERQAGWTSGRKTRTDKGRSRQGEDALHVVAALQRGSVRANGKQTMFTPLAASIAATNGHDITVSARQINRLTRARRLGVAQQQESHAPVQLRSLHPNHVHQVDPSLCLVYYLRGEQKIIRDDEFYKNKLEKLAKVQWKVWRYVLWDHASGLVLPWYVQAAGESPLNLYKFLMHAWGQQPGRRFHGVPKVLMWDKGSANTAFAVQNLLRALEVESITHAAGNARAKGGVENANNLVETQFESRLRFDPVHSVEEMNARATQWAEAYNANALPHQDTRLRREGIPAVARYDLWMKIRQDELRLLPPEPVCQHFLEGKTITRKVSRDMTVSYAHPRAEGSRRYALDGIAGVCAGDVLEISPLLFGDCAIRVRVPRFDGEDVHHRLEPIADLLDDYGRPLSAPVIGETWARRADTDADRAGKMLDGLLFPGMTAEQMDKARRGNAALMGGMVDAVRHLEHIEIPAALPRKGKDISIAAPVFEAPPMTHFEASKALRGRGIERADLYPWLAAQYPDGVPEVELDTIAARLRGDAPAPRLQAVG